MENVSIPVIIKTIKQKKRTAYWKKPLLYLGDLQEKL